MGTRKTNVSEPPMKCRDLGNDIETGVSMRSRDESGGRPIYWPGGVRHAGGVSLVCGCCGELGKACVDIVPDVDSGGRHERESVDQQKLGQRPNPPVAVGDVLRPAEVVGLALPGHADHVVRGVGLVAVLGQPDPGAREVTAEQGDD